METVRVIYHHEGDGWWAESPDVEGWSAAGESYVEVVKLAEEGIPFALSGRPSWSTTSRPASQCPPRLAGASLVTLRRLAKLRRHGIGELGLEPPSIHQWETADHSIASRRPQARGWLIG